MQNPMLRNLNQSRMMSNLAPLKNVINNIRMAKNPEAMFEQMMSQNPNMRQALEYVKQNGGDSKQALYQMMNEQGLNPDEIIKQLLR